MGTLELYITTQKCNYRSYPFFVLYNRLPPKEKKPSRVELDSLTSMCSGKGSKAAFTANQVNVIHQFFSELLGMD